MGNPKTRQNAFVVLGFGAVLLVAGAVVGLVPFDSICGPAFFGLERTTTNLLDETICTSRHAGLIPTAIGLLIVGALTVVISGVVAAVAGSGATGRQSGLTAELRDLAQLRASGQLSDDEYTAAKAKLLDA